MNKAIKIIIGLVVVGLAVWGLSLVGKKGPAISKEPIKVGIITDLTGPAAYWGESTRAGADILQKELATEGKNVTFVIEDYQLDAAKAASAAQKLVNLDKVQAIYAEFNPAAVASASVLKDKGTPLVYVAALTSPLAESPLFFKTYLDYQEGCKQISQKFESEGVEKIGLLKMNLEPPQLCEVGMREIYGDNIAVEGYTLGDTDLRTQLLKLNNSKVQVVVNMAFEGDTVNTLRVLRDFKYDMRYGTVDDSITPEVIKNYTPQLDGAWTFGFNEPTEDFKSKISSYDLVSPYAAALAYTHLRQLVDAVSVCGDDTDCLSEEIANSPANETIGFRGYQDRIANLKMNLKKY